MEKNITVLNDIWLNGTNDFQQRIPQPTQSNIKKVIEELFEPMNRNYYNQFMDSLIMRIGDTYVHQTSFKNPLAVFKKNKLQYGSTIQEIIPKWIKAHSYVDNADDVFKMTRPDAYSWYHSQNRRDRYDITVSDTELRTAFLSDNGLNTFVASLMQTPVNSDEYDEYRIMLQLIAFYENEWGFYKHHLSAIPNDSATSKEFLKAARSYAIKLSFPNTIYNSGELSEVPIFAKQNELVLLLTPEVAASIDVDALAAVFNLDKAQIKYRTIYVDELPIPNACALLTTEDFFQCRDTEYRTTSIYNPKTLSTNYFLNHWGIYSVSPFVPAILFTTDEGTSVQTVTQSVTGITATLDDETPDKGDAVPIKVTLKGTLNPAGVKNITVAPDASTYDVSVTRDGTAVNSPATRVDEYGILHVSNKLAYGDVIKVSIKSTYVNPSGATSEYTTSVTATVTQ